MFTQSQLLQNGRNSAPWAEDSTDPKQGGSAAPGHCSPCSQGFHTSGFVPQLQCWVHVDPMPTTQVTTDTAGSQAPGAPSHPGCPQALKEKSHHPKCQLDCHIRNVFTGIPCFDRFGTENKTEIYEFLAKSIGMRFMLPIPVEGLG